MTPLSSRLKAALAFDDRAKTLEAEFRYACYPDADKDELQTLLADYACHGFASGVGVKFDRIKPMLEKLLAVVAAAEFESDNVCELDCTCALCEALAELRKECE